MWFHSFNYIHCLSQIQSEILHYNFFFPFSFITFSNKGYNYIDLKSGRAAIYGATSLPRSAASLAEGTEKYGGEIYEHSFLRVRPLKGRARPTKSK